MPRMGATRPTVGHMVGGQAVRYTPYTARRGMIDISTDTFNGIEQFLRWSGGVPQRFNFWMDQLVRFMAYTNQGFAQGMSAGPYDPSQSHPEWAWRTPERGIRRISEKYYLGWKVRRRGFGTWQLYNDSREAFYIEFGIHQSNRRIRRPVRKLSLRKTLYHMMRTQAYHRVWAEIYVGPNKHGVRSRGFTQTVQSPAKGSFTGPMLGRRLPG